MIASREKREINRNDHLIGSKPQAQPNLVLKVPCKGAGDNRPFVAEDNTLIERSAQRDYGDDRICAAQGSGEFLQAIQIRGIRRTVRGNQTKSTDYAQREKCATKVMESAQTNSDITTALITSNPPCRPTPQPYSALAT